MERNISALCQPVIVSSYQLVGAKQESKMNYFSRSLFAAKLQAVVVNLRKIKLPNPYFSQILTLGKLLNSYLVTCQKARGIQWGCYSPIHHPPLLRLPKILSKNILKHFVDQQSLAYRAVFAVFLCMTSNVVTV